MNYCEMKASCIKGVYRENVLIDRQYALGDIARLIQRVAEKAMDELGTGYSRLKAKHLIWVTCFSEIRINRIPVDGKCLRSIHGREKSGLVCIPGGM